MDNHEQTGAPVVVENNPTYHNLIGRIAHQSFWGGVVTDFTLLKAGALRRARPPQQAHQPRCPLLPNCAKPPPARFNV